MTDCPNCAAMRSCVESALRMRHGPPHGPHHKGTPAECPDGWCQNYARALSSSSGQDFAARVWNEAVEACAQAADTEPEMDGPAPADRFTVRDEAVARATVRATKKSIAIAIRALKKPEGK